MSPGRAAAPLRGAGRADQTGAVEWSDEELSPLGRAALSYAARGWPVFPLRAGDKRPMPGSRGCHDATTHLDAVVGWWSAHPTANVGVATGHAVEVLDLDGDAGCAAWDRWCADLGWSLNVSAWPIVGTPSGGLHFYGAPVGAGNRVRMLPCVDWRARGGYVVAPPSMLEDGRGWRWLEPVPPDLGTWPTEVGELARHEERPTATPAPPKQMTDGDASAYGAAALRRASEAVASAPVGERNGRLNSEALGIFRLVAGGEVAEHVAVAWLTSAALHAGLGELEIGLTLASARRAGMAQPRRAPERVR